MNNLIIRKIEKRDIQKVAEIQVNAWKKVYKGIIDDFYLKNINVKDKIKEREKDYDKNGFIVAEIDGEVVGFCRYIYDDYFNFQVRDADCELLAIYIRDDLKQTGIGTKLFEYMKNEFIDNNKKKMIVWCLKENIGAKIFYKKMGGRSILEKKIQIGYKKYLVECFEYEL